MVEDDPADGWDVDALRREARGELSPAEFDRLALLSPQARRTALVRLHQILRWRRAPHGSKGALERFLRGTGVGRDRFYELARNFSATASVASLGVGLPGARTGLLPDRRTSRIEADRLRVERLLREILAKDPSVSTGTMIAAVRGLDLSRQPSVSTIYKWTAAVRARLRGNGLGSPLAALVAVDAEDGRGSRHELALVVDRGTGLVAGAAVATGRDALDAFVLAMRDGAARLRSLRLPGVLPASGPIALEVEELVDSGSNVMNGLRLHRDLRPEWRPVPPKVAVRAIHLGVGRWLGPLRIDATPLPRRMGEEGLRTVRGSGTARTAARRHGTTSGADLSAMPTEEELVEAYASPRPMMENEALEDVLKRAVDDHNRSVLKRFGGGREQRSTREMRNRMADVLDAVRSEKR